VSAKVGQGSRPVEQLVRLGSEVEGVENTTALLPFDLLLLPMCAPLMFPKEFARRLGPWKVIE
jgi:hypothetical protein